MKHSLPRGIQPLLVDKRLSVSTGAALDSRVRGNDDSRKEVVNAPGPSEMPVARAHIKNRSIVCPGRSFVIPANAGIQVRSRSANTNAFSRDCPGT